MSQRAQRFTLGIVIGLTAAVILVANFYNYVLVVAFASIVLLLEIALIAPVFEEAEW